VFDSFFVSSPPILGKKMSEHDLSKKVADRYLKREVLGEGTYGVVYKAIDTQVTFSDV